MRVLVVATGLATGACGIMRTGPALSASYFKTSLCSAVIDGKDHTTRLRITLEVVQALPAGALVQTEFQIPGEKAALTSNRLLAGAERKLTITSPPVPQIRAGVFETVTRVYDARDGATIIGVHTQRCESLLDRREMGPEFR